MGAGCDDESEFLPYLLKEEPWFLEDEELDDAGEEDSEEDGCLWDEVEDAGFVEDELDYVEGEEDDEAGFLVDELEDAAAESDTLLWLPDDWLLLVIVVVTWVLLVGWSLTV